MLPYRKNWYVEPFCGGCNVIDKVDGNRIANDVNHYLIAMFEAMTHNTQYLTHISKELYSAVRDDYNNKTGLYRDDFIGYVGWMGSYNGRFFDGGYSGHNVKGRDYIGEQIRNTLLQIDSLRGVQFKSVDYRKLNIPSESLVYCDIPYRGTKQYSTSVNFEYDTFYEWCRAQSRAGNKIFVSEYNMPEDFKCVWQKQVTNAMHPTKTYKPIEKLFTL